MQSNLREVMNRSNQKNSQLLKAVFNEAMYNKSRAECQQQLTKRQKQLLRQRDSLEQLKQSSLNTTLANFENDYQKMTQKVLGQIRRIMDNNKRNYCNEIRQKKMLETPDEKQLKIEINAMLDKIHEHLEGLQKKDLYRKYIAEVVLTDYDTRMEDISSRKNRIKNVVVGLAIDENVYACMRKDAANLGLVEYGGLAGTFDKDRSSNTTLKPGDFVNPHSNRDVIRKNCFDV